MWIMEPWLPRYPDPFGYISAAAFFSGTNWSSLTRQLTGYYGFGYGLLLAPLFYLSSNYLMFSKMAIVLNALFLVLTYWIMIDITRRVFRELGEFSCCLIPFIAVLFPAYLYEINTIIPELFSVLCFAGSIWLVLNVEERVKPVISLLSFSVIVGLSPMIHGRNVALWISGIIVVNLFLYKKRISVMAGICCIIVLFVLMGCYYLTSRYVRLELYSSDPIQNTAETLLEGASNYFNLQAVRNYIWSLTTQFWYMGTSTLLISFLGMYYLIRLAANRSAFRLFHLYIAFSGSGIMLISAYVFTNPRRLDQVIFGRHNEMVLSIFLLYGLAYLAKDEINMRRTVTVIILLFCVCALATHRRINGVEYLSSIPRSITGVSLLYEPLLDNPEVILLSSILEIIAATLLVILLNIKGKTRFMAMKVVYVMVTVFFIITSVHATKREKRYNDTERVQFWALEEIIESYPSSRLVVIKDGTFNTSASFLYITQIIGYKKPVECMTIQEIETTFLQDEICDCVFFSNDENHRALFSRSLLFDGFCEYATEKQQMFIWHAHKD